MTASSEFVAAGEGTAQQGAGPQADRRSPRRWWLTVGVWALGVVAAFACYLRLADTRAVNSDGSGQALQAWDMLHGNLLLHGWQLTDITMYTTELPEYMLVELVRGLNTDVVHVAATVTYVLVLALAALLAKGRATGRAALVRVLIAVGIMIAPQLAQGINILISSPDHFGTSVPLLLLWLIVDRAKPRWYVPVAVAVLLAWATFADSLVFIIGVLPLVLVCAIRVLRAVRVGGQSLQAQRYELGLGAGGLVGGAAAWLALHHLPASAFTLGAVNLHLASPATIPHHVNIALQGLLLLGGADFIGQPAGVASAFMVLHLVGVALAALGVIAALAQFARGKNLVDDVLASAVVFNVIAYVLSTLAVAVFASREFDPVLPFAAVLAGRLLADRILAIKLLPAVLLVVLAGYLGGLGYEVAQPPVPAQNQQLATWLEQHHLELGLSGYWQSSVVTLATQEHVRVLQVVATPRQRVVPYVWEVKSTWFDPRQNTANFVVLAPTLAEYTGFTDEKAVLATFGTPAHDYHVGPYQILVYSKNLLTDLSLRSAAKPRPGA